MCVLADHETIATELEILRDGLKPKVNELHKMEGNLNKVKEVKYIMFIILFIYKTWCVDYI